MRAVPRWFLAWIIVGCGIVTALNIPPVRVPADAAGLRRFQVEIDPATRVSQTFLMTADGLHGVEFSAAATRKDVSGILRVELYDVTDGHVVRRTDVEAADVVKAAAYRFEFPPIDDSKDQFYRLDLLAGDSSPVEGLAVQATKGDRYSAGTMLINERERWADLAFATFAPAGQSSWRRLMDASAGAALAGITVGTLTAYWAALGVVLKYLPTLCGARRRESTFAEAAPSA